MCYNAVSTPWSQSETFASLPVQSTVALDTLQGPCSGLPSGCQTSVGTVVFAQKLWGAFVTGADDCACFQLAGD